MLNFIMTLLGMIPSKNHDLSDIFDWGLENLVPVEEESNESYLNKIKKRFS